MIQITAGKYFTYWTYFYASGVWTLDITLQLSGTLKV